MASPIDRAHSLLGELYETRFFSADFRKSSAHQRAAAQLREAILDLFWDPERLTFYDFNLTSSARNSFFSAAHFYPLWSGVIPPEVFQASSDNADRREERAFVAYGSALEMILKNYKGTFPATFKKTGQQWDMPNAWPPHQQIILEALSKLPSDLSTKPLSKLISGEERGQEIEKQLKRRAEDLFTVSDQASSPEDLKEHEGETWTQTLQRALANRYMASVLCSWHATGGSIPGMLDRLPDEELNITHSINETGHVSALFLS